MHGILVPDLDRQDVTGRWKVNGSVRRSNNVMDNTGVVDPRSGRISVWHNSMVT